MVLLFFSCYYPSNPIKGEKDMENTKQQRIKEAMKPLISEKLKNYRKSNGLTQEQMAREYGMSVRSYVDLERGICFPSATTFAQLLTSLNQEELKSLLADIKDTVEPFYK